MLCLHWYCVPFCSFKQNNETFSNVKTTINKQCQICHFQLSVLESHSKRTSHPQKTTTLSTSKEFIFKPCFGFRTHVDGIHLHTILRWEGKSPCAMYLYTFIAVFSHTEPHLRAKRLIHPLALSQHRPRDAKQQKTRQEERLPSILRIFFTQASFTFRPG